MDDKEFYLDAIRDVVPEHKEEQIQDVFYSFLELEHLYDSAIELVKAQLNIFDNEFSMRFQRNPIHNIESRIKTPQSIVGKLQRKEMPVTPESARNNLTDIAGVRVICCYIDDIYAIADLLTDHSAFQLRKIKDYIKNPKPSGYRSLHLIIEIPIFLQNEKKMMKVEVQFRTIAMDFWASLEHKLQYKKNIPESQAKFLKDELYDCAQQSAALDKRMQNIRNVIAESETKEEEKQDFLPIFLRENKG